MNNKFCAKDITFSAVFIAIGLLLPMVFHKIGAGSKFLPMHIPILMAGLYLGWKNGILIGFITPILSHFITGMPPLMPMLPIMMFELAVYGLMAGLLYKKFKLNIYLSLIISMFVGRIVAGVTMSVLVNFFAFNGPPMLVYIMGTITNGIIGIIIQLIFIPPIVKILEKNIKIN